MYLGDLIDRLKAEDPNKGVPLGFKNPHSYRGYYDCLAFEPAENVTVASMLLCAQEAVGATYQGYKGGNFNMDIYTRVYLAHYGDMGEEIGPTLLDYMMGRYRQ